MKTCPDWQVEQLRLTVFLQARGGSEALSARLWSSLIGGEPESRIERSAVRTVVEEGMFEGHRVTLSLHPDRIDIVFHSAPIEPGLPVFGPIEERLERFRQVIEQAPYKGCVRLAFGGVMLAPAADHKAAYRTLAEYLPSVKISEDSSDFMYQINRPVDSRVCKGLLINRLSKWAAIRLQFMTLDSPVAAKQFELYATRLEIDINTNPESPLEEALDHLELVNELIEHGRQLWLQGDVT